MVKFGLFIKTIFWRRRMKKIYFLCSGESNRAQIAEGFARTYLSNKFEFISTSYPEEKPMLEKAVQTMKEIGIDISNYTSPSFDLEFYKSADYIISVCENGIVDINLIPTKAQHIHIQVDDPLEIDDYYLQLKSFRKVRDHIGVIIKEFSKEVVSEHSGYLESIEIFIKAFSEQISSERSHYSDDSIFY